MEEKPSCPQFAAILLWRLFSCAWISQVSRLPVEAVKAGEESVYQLLVYPRLLAAGPGGWLTPMNNLFVYLLIYWRGDMWGGAEGERESQADWPVSAEPEAGLDLTTSGS